MIVFDASTLVGAALKQDSVPERALFKARHHDTIAISAATENEIVEMTLSPWRSVPILRPSEYLLWSGEDTGAIAAEEGRPAGTDNITR